MNLLCKTGIHRYEHCRCTRCGIRRDAGHDWNGCKCTVCGKTRDESHRWNGCKCTVCGKTRDEGHRWDGCICPACGKKREEGHVWDGCICKKCGSIRPYETDGNGKIRSAHDWDGCKCRKCGLTRNEGHRMPPELLAKELAKDISGGKSLHPMTDIKFQCLRCRREVTLKGGKTYCPECLSPVEPTLGYTDSPTIMKQIFKCAKCGYRAEKNFSDG